MADDASRLFFNVYSDSLTLIPSEQGIITLPMTIDVKKQFNLSVKNNQRHSGCDIKRGGGGAISDLTKGKNQ